MSRKYCPRPDYAQYRQKPIFQGSLISILEPAEQGLFYVIDQKFFDRFREIDDELNKMEAFKKPPDFGSFFLYYDIRRKTKFRAYRLNSNPANAIAVRAFLYDTGEETYENFQSNVYFKMPQSLLMIPAMAVFCYLQSFPLCEDDTDKLKSEFLEASLYKKLAFNVLHEKATVTNNLGKNQLCLVVEVVEVLEADDFSTDTTSNSVGTSEKNSQEISLSVAFNYLQGPTKSHVPFMMDKVAKMPKLSKEKQFVFITECSRPDSIYVHLLASDQITEMTSSELMELNIWMNHEFVEHRPLTCTPIINEMVVAEGKDHRFHRGLIIEVIESTSIIQFVDYGYSAPIRSSQLYEFPTQFSYLPFQAIRIVLANIEPINDPVTDIQAIEMLKSNVTTTLVMAKLVQFEPTYIAEMFTVNGFNIGDVLLASGLVKSKIPAQ